MNKEARERSKHTWFRKGNLPTNTLFDGAIRARKGSNNKQYYWIRLSLANWMPLHRYLWGQERGEIPKGGIIRFRDGNTLNCSLDNLELISRKENAERNIKEEGQNPAQRLTDGYIKAILATNTGMNKEQVTPEMIELKRTQLLLNRENP